MIFFVILIMLWLLSGAVSLFYFYYLGKSRIGEIESYTRNYSLTLSEAFADVAELSFASKNYRKLKSLFQEKIRENTIDEGFFVLASGKIIVHSDKNAEKKLNGNIGNDEFAYNTELIFSTLRGRTKETMFVDYNIINRSVPFDRDTKKVLKKYLYGKIDVNGWLTTRAVFSKNMPVGTVNFILSKDRIYRFLLAHIQESLRLALFCASASLLISLLVSFMFFFRYRSLQKSLPAIVPEQIAGQDRGVPQEKEEPPAPVLAEIEMGTETEETGALEMAAGAETAPGEAVVDRKPSREIEIIFEEEGRIDARRTIKDAIPLRISKE